MRPKNPLRLFNVLWLGQSFIYFNNSMCSTPFLAVPDFTKPFVLECDALGTSLWVVLTQEGRPITFIRK